MSTKKKQILAMKVTPCTLINGFLYKMGLDEVHCRCVLEHERENIMHEVHYGPSGGHFQSNTTAKKIQQLKLWWLTLKKDCQKFVSKFDRCQHLGRPLPSTDIPLISINPILTFKIWAIDFRGPFPVPTKMTSARYFITTVEYITKWENTKPVETCFSEVVAKFIYENIIIIFDYPLTLISDQGSHFINKTIAALIDQFKINQRRSTAYHPWSNGAIKAFNKTLTRVLMKNLQHCQRRLG